MSLRDQKDPIVLVWEEKGKTKWVSRVKDDKVVCNLDDRAAWHISHGRAYTWIEVTQLDTVCVTTCDDVRFFFSFLPFIYHMYFYSQSHDWQTSFSHMTHLESYITFPCDSSSYDSHQFRLTHSDSLVFHLLFHFIYICFIFCFMTHMRTSIVLVTSCSSDIIVLCDVHCSCDAIVHFTIKSGLLSSL